MTENLARMSIGVSVSVRNSSGNLIKNIFDPIIYKGDILPCTRNRTYRTTRPLQTAINLKVYGGESPFVEDNLELGNFLIENIPKNKTGKEKVDISFHVDEHLLLYINIKIRSSGKEETRAVDTKMIQKELASFNSIYKDNIWE